MDYDTKFQQMYNAKVEEIAELRAKIERYEETLNHIANSKQALWLSNVEIARAALEVKE